MARKVVWHTFAVSILLQWLQKLCFSQWEEGHVLTRGSCWEMITSEISFIFQFHHDAFQSPNSLFLVKAKHQHVLHLLLSCFFQIIKIWSLLSVLWSTTQKGMLTSDGCGHSLMAGSDDKAGLAFILSSLPIWHQEKLQILSVIFEELWIT